MYITSSIFCIVKNIRSMININNFIRYLLQLYHWRSVGNQNACLTGGIIIYDFNNFPSWLNKNTHNVNGVSFVLSWLFNGAFARN